jgi:hypothetical protein
MTDSILTPLALVAIVIILGCVLAALYSLARRRTPSAKPAPQDSKAPVPRDAPLPRVAPPRPAARPAPDDGPGRTVLMKPDSLPNIPPATRVPGAPTPARDERRRGMDEIEHRRRAANTRLKGERPPRPAAGDSGASTEERVITAGSAAPPQPPPPRPTVLLPREDDERIGTGAEIEAPPAPAAVRPQQPVTKRVEDDEITTPKRVETPEPAKEGSAPAAVERDGPQADQMPRPEAEPSVVLAESQASHDIVDCTVFAPPRIAAGERVMVQAHLHLAEQVAKVRRAAAEIDRRANLQGNASLLQPLARGVEVELYLACPGLIVDEPLQKVKWEGTPTHVVFNVEAPPGLAPDPINAAVYLSLDGIPIGDVAFRIYVAYVRPADSEDAAMPVPADLATATAARTRGTSYNCAFVSYARKDFDRVSLFAQGLTQRDMELAFDVASLEPGADWGTKLPELIGRCNVFYLMWSDNAAQSKWVEKEARLAVWLHHKSQRGAPRIVPITLHRPAPRPPGFLGPFHFDSPWLAQRAAQAVPLFKEAPPQ